MSSWQAGRARTDAKSALVRLRRQAEEQGDVDRARHLRQAKICMELAHKLYREGWYKG